MENLRYKYKMLGLVTLYNPDVEVASDNIKRYIHDLDSLIIWDNSPFEANLKQLLQASLESAWKKIIWIGNGENRCIAPAINHAWQYAKEHAFDFLLIMDQDSKWADFPNYRLQIEHFWTNGKKWVYTPFFEGVKELSQEQPVQFIRLFINSGTVIPIEILSAVGGADEAMPLDALDHDLAIRIQKAGYQVVCITSSTLYHTLGTPSKSESLHLMTNNYSAWRTYSIARSHIINYRKHRDWLTFADKKRIVNEYFLLRFIRIVLLETDKANKIKMLLKGIKEGLTYKLET